MPSHPSTFTKNRLGAGLCTGLLLATACGQPGPSTEPRQATDEVGRVFLLGIDGATWRVMDPMIESGDLPNFEELTKVGCRGLMRSDPVSTRPPIFAT